MISFVDTVLLMWRVSVLFFVRAGGNRVSGSDLRQRSERTGVK